MADKTVRKRLFAPAFAIPPGVDSSAPLRANVNVGDVIVDTVEIIIPAGHSFLTGIGVEYSNARVLPFDDPPAFLVGDADDQTFPLDLQVSTPLVLVGYNVDIYPHTFHLRIRVHDFTVPGVTAAFTPIPAAMLSTS